MNKFVNTVIALSGMLLTTSALAQGDIDYAQVTAVRPIVQIVEVSTPEERCWQEEYLVDRRYGHSQSNTPGILGAIIGGAIGNELGNHKSSQRVGTVVGAVLGHSVARDIMRQQEGPTVREVETVERCETVYQSYEEERIVGYNVTYNYNGQDYTIRTDHDPGDRIRVRVSVQPIL